MRYPDEALEYGIDQLSSCFDGVSAADVVKTVHLCCGYPNYLVSNVFQHNFIVKNSGRLFSSNFLVLTISPNQCLTPNYIIKHTLDLRIIKENDINDHQG